VRLTRLSFSCDDFNHPKQANDSINGASQLTTSGSARFALISHQGNSWRFR
jgi:hypothetical protein